MRSAQDNLMVKKKKCPNWQKSQCVPRLVFALNLELDVETDKDLVRGAASFLYTILIHRVSRGRPPPPRTSHKRRRFDDYNFTHDRNPTKANPYWPSSNDLETREPMSFIHTHMVPMEIQLIIFTTMFTFNWESIIRFCGVNHVVYEPIPTLNINLHFFWAKIQ